MAMRQNQRETQVDSYRYPLLVPEPEMVSLLKNRGGNGRHSSTNVFLVSNTSVQIS